MLGFDGPFNHLTEIQCPTLVLSAEKGTGVEKDAQIHMANTTNSSQLLIRAFCAI